MIYINMNVQNIYETLKKNFNKCLSEEKSGRKDLLSKCTSALLNAKSNKKKLLILLGQMILEDDNNRKLILNDNDIIDSAIKLINNAFENNLNDDIFSQKFFNLSKTMNFFYQVSKLYVKLFSNEFQFHEIFISLISKTKYEKNKIDYINSLRILITNNTIEKYKYEELLQYIDKNYDNKNDFKMEYIKLFLKNDSYCDDIINDIFNTSAKNNKLKLEEIMNKNNINQSKLYLNNNKIKNEDKIKDVIEIKETKEDIIITSDKVKENILEKNIISTNEIKEKNETIISNTNNLNEIIENDNIIKGYKMNDSENKINLNNNDNIKSNEIFDNIKNKNECQESINNKKINEQHESPEITDRMSNELTVNNYFSEQYKKYNTKNFEPLSLEFILKNKINFKKDDISYVRNLTDRNFDPKKKLNDKILNDLLYKLKLNNNIPDTDNFGYFCYKNKENKNIEALYSIIKSEILYDDITKINKAENFYEDNKEIQNE